MTLPTGESPISFSQIRTEFGDGTNTATSPVRLGQYRATDPSFTNESPGDFSNLPLDTGIPISGAINVDAFHGKKLNVIIDYYSGSTENRPNDARTKYQAASASGNRVVVGGYKDRVINDSSGSKVRIHVNKEIGSATGNVNNCALRTGSFETGTVVTVEVGSSGGIYGAGGNGGGHGEDAEDPHGENGGAGTSALGIQHEGTTVINNGSIVAGGGGGGGGGARRVEREETGYGPVISASGGGGGGGQGLPPGEGVDGGADGTTTAGGEGGTGGMNTTNGDTHVFGGGGGGGGSNGEGGEAGSVTDNTGTLRTGSTGNNGTTSKGGNGAAGSYQSNKGIEGNYDTTGNGGIGGDSGAAIRKTDGTITVNITNNATITGATDATGVS